MSGFSQRDQQRIAQAVLKSERTQSPDGILLGKPGALRVRRVKLQGDLSEDTPTSGTERLQRADRSAWIDTDIVVNEIYQGSPALSGLGEDDEVWVVPQSGRWYAIAEAGGQPASNGCCAACFSRDSLGVTSETITGLSFANRYAITQIRASLGGPEIVVEYIGISSGLTTEGTPDGVPYWESDSFSFSCDAGTDSYKWRLHFDDTDCTTADGSSKLKFYLVRVSSAAVCTDLADSDCGGIDTYAYHNISGWRPHCGHTLYVRGGGVLRSALDDLLNCTVCVRPIGNTCSFCAGVEIPDVLLSTVTRIGASCPTPCAPISAVNDILTFRYQSGTLAGVPGWQFRHEGVGSFTTFTLFCDDTGVVPGAPAGWRFKYTNCDSLSGVTGLVGSTVSLSLVSCSPLQIAVTDIPCDFTATPSTKTFDLLFTEP